MGEELKRFDTVPYKGSLEDIPYYSVDDVPLSHACVLDVAIDFAHAQFRWRKMFHFPNHVAVEIEEVLRALQAIFRQYRHVV